MTKAFVNHKRKNQYDEFLHKIQQEKMKELWGSKEDEAWDNVKESFTPQAAITIQN